MVRAAFVFMVLLLVGCEDGSRADSRTLDVEDEDFRQGQNFYKSGEVRKALECYLKVIDKRKGAAESNLEAGRMYLELEDPLPAIYHFNQYIRMKPTSEQSNLVRQLIKTAEKQFMQKLPGRPMDPDALGGTDLNAKLRNLQTENEKLKRELADYNRTQKGLVLPPKTTGEKPADKPAASDRRRQAAALPPIHGRERRQSFEHRPQDLRRSQPQPASPRSTTPTGTR
jgi:tetratricopeptide (TPR) repeat protein